MRKQIFYIAAIAAVMLAASGCIREDAVKFHGISDIDIAISLNPRLEATMEVENTSGRNITIKDILFDVTDTDGNVIGTLKVNKDLFIPKRSTTALQVPVNISFTNPLTGLALMNNIGKASSGLYLNGGATVRMGGVKKKMRFEHTPIESFINYFKANSGKQDITIIDKAPSTDI